MAVVLAVLSPRGLTTLYTGSAAGAVVSCAEAGCIGCSQRRLAWRATAMSHMNEEIFMTVTPVNSEPSGSMLDYRHNPSLFFTQLVSSDNSPSPFFRRARKVQTFTSTRLGP